MPSPWESTCSPSLPWALAPQSLPSSSPNSARTPPLTPISPPSKQETTSFASPTAPATTPTPRGTQLKVPPPYTAVLNKMGIVVYRSDNTLPINVQSCTDWNTTQYPLTNQLAWLEMFFNCSGWCSLNSDPPYYVFSNINYGVPNGGPCA